MGAWPSRSIMGAAWERDRCMARAEQMDAHANALGKSDFARSKAVEWRDRALNEACHWDALTR